MKTKPNIKQFLISLLVLGLICGASTVLAQPQKPRMNPLAQLKNALQAAGAPELSPEQESDIQSLMLDFRNALQNRVQDTNAQSAREAYEEAILAGDSGAAATQAAILADAAREAELQRHTDVAVFAIDVIAILDPASGRADALVNQMGTRGFVRLITGLVNGPARGRLGMRPGGGPPPDFGAEVP